MQAGYASDGNGNTIRLEVSTLAGVIFDVQLPSDAPGSALFEEIAKKCELYGSQTVPMAFIGNALVSFEEELGSQVSKHGNMVALTLRQVEEAEQVNVTKKVMDNEDLNPQELHIWRGIKVLGEVLRLPKKVGLPDGLQSLTFGALFNQSMERVSLPAGLLSLTFGERFNQRLEKVSLPDGLQSLTFGLGFDQSMEKVSLPAGLQSLTFGEAFNQSMEKVSLPAGLQSLSFGEAFNQSWRR